MWLKVIAVVIFTMSWDTCPPLTSHAEQEDPYEKDSVTLGVILPTSALIKEPYYENLLATTVENLARLRDNSSDPLPNIHFELIFWPERPSLNATLQLFCKLFSANQFTAFIHLTVSEEFMTDIASTQYFLRLVDHLGIPVISWNAINPNFDKVLPNSVNLQLSHATQQAEAMISILMKYKWNTFAVLTTRIAGYNHFLQAIYEEIYLRQHEFNFNLQISVTLYKNDSYHVRELLTALLETQVRVILLYATLEEAKYIFKEAANLKMTAKDYIWIVTQSVVGSTKNTQPVEDLPIGLLGVNFDTSCASDAKFMKAIEMAVLVVIHGLHLFENDSSNVLESLKSNVSCGSLDDDAKWLTGVSLSRNFKDVNFTNTRISDITLNPETVKFLLDETMENVMMEIVNFNKSRLWKKVGWWYKKELAIADVEWPDGSHIPPSGSPDKYHFRISFLEEEPYLTLGSLDDETGECPYEGVSCRIPAALRSEDIGLVVKNESYSACCYGICIDLLVKLSKDLNFDYDLTRVEDGLWGTQTNGTWNGLIKELLDGKADMLLTSLKVNEERATAVDFSSPFMETGIAVIVAKRTGIISLMAFLEPFDPITWFFILVVGIQFAAVTIFLFEWLSPDGFDRKLQQPIGHKFSLFRTYWLVWSLLFGASVNMNIPRGYTARFMCNMWASFRVVFHAIYTAHLASFMITREEYFRLSGVGDPRLIYPSSQVPALKFGTVVSGNTYSVLKSKYPLMHQHMTPFNKGNVQQGVEAVKKGELDAFIYDASVLDYLVGKDDECRILTVGTWYAMSGYGIAFPRKSRHLRAIDNQLLAYRASGQLEQWTKFWLTGACKPSKETQTELGKSAYTSLTLQQYMSAFFLLGGGIILSALILALENCYFAYVRKPLSRGNRGCCTLVSLNLGESLTFKETVEEVRDAYLIHKCKNPLCDTLLWRTRRELDLAKIEIEHLKNEQSRNVAVK